MAVIYVSSAGDDSDGLSWATAWQSVENAAVDGAAAGSIIWVDSIQAETSATVLVLDFVNSTALLPIILVSVDKSDDSYAPGATLTANGNGDLNIDGCVSFYGFTLDVDDDAFFGSLDSYQRYEDCTILADDVFQNSNGESVVEFVNCPITSDETSAAGVFSSTADNSTIFRGCTIQHPNTVTLVSTATDSASFLFEDCDLSSHTDNVTTGISIADRVHVTLRRCKMKAGWTLHAGNGVVKPNSFIFAENCRSGVIGTEPELGIGQQQGYADIYGEILSTLARRRTGGADDGENVNEYSWEMAANANTLEVYLPLRSQPMARWVGGGSEITITVHVASGVTLQDDEFWIELSGPDTTANPNQTTLGHRETTRADPNAAANLTTDAVSTWTGAGVGTKQKVSITYTPTVAGPITVRACLANTAGLTVYVDPKLEVA